MGRFLNTDVVSIACTMSYTSLFLQYNGKEILWKHVQDLYHRDSGAQRSGGGLSLVPKLRYEHIYLTSFSKMRVDLASQVVTRISKYKYYIYIYFHLLFPRQVNQNYIFVILGTQQLSVQSFDLVR